MTKPVATSRVCPVPVVGLVGGVGSGKSAVARWVADRHPVLVIDGDRAGHQALELPAVREQLRQQFGPGIFDADGNVIRSALARLVFGDTAAHRLAREQLERIVHPEIRRLLEQQLRAVNASTIRHVLLDAAVLLEAGWSEVCDAIVFVESSKAVREARVAGRGWSAAELSRREASQWPLEKKRKAATAVVENDGPLESAGAALWSLLLRWAPD